MYSNEIDKSRHESSRFNFKTVLQIIIAAIFIIFLLKLTALDFLRIESDSMYPVLKNGDQVLMSRLGYYLGFSSVIPFTNFENPFRFAIWYRQPEVGDVIVYRYTNPQDDESKYKYVTKRVRAVPGDTVYYQNIDDVLTYNLYPPIDYLHDYKRAILPKRGDKVVFDSINADFYLNLIRKETSSAFATSESFLTYGSFTNSYTFKNSYYFVTGDNYRNSFDSRFYGPISTDNIEGKLLFRYFSHNVSKSFSFINFKWL